MKIAVYTCALNEEQFVERWVNSAIEADQRLVLDTGSTDKTVEALRDLGVMVGHASIKPWRFDDAKNAALNLLSPKIDIAVQLDLDEVLTANWRQNLEAAWQFETTRLHYKYVWSWTPDGRPDRIYFADKIGGRHTHRWKNPVHEVLMPTVPEVVAVCPEVLIEHHPDNNKSRDSYLPLLELSTREDPLNDRNSHYLGREYFFHKKYKEAIAEFKRHITLPTACWQAERAASLRYGGKCYESLEDHHHAYKWFALATLEDSQSREAFVDLAGFLLRRGNWQGVLYYTTEALKIPPDQSSYINERYALEEGPFDLASVAFYNLGDQKSALACAKKAIELNPFDERIRANLSMIEAKGD